MFYGYIWNEIIILTLCDSKGLTIARKNAKTLSLNFKCKKHNKLLYHGSDNLLRLSSSHAMNFSMPSSPQTLGRFLITHISICSIFLQTPFQIQFLKFEIRVEPYFVCLGSLVFEVERTNKVKEDGWVWSSVAMCCCKQITDNTGKQRIEWTAWTFFRLGHMSSIRKSHFSTRICTVFCKKLFKSSEDRHIKHFW